MKRFWLSLRNWHFKKHPLKRHTISFDQARHFGFVCASVKQYQLIQPILKEITQDGNMTKVIVQKSSKKQTGHQGFPTFHPGELDWLGRYSSSSMKVFEQEKFDFLFYLDRVYNPMIESLLLRTQASCRVGFYDQNKEYLFEFMFHFDEAQSNIENVNAVFQNIKKIKSNEQ